MVRIVTPEFPDHGFEYGQSAAFAINGLAVFPKELVMRVQLRVDIGGMQEGNPLRFTTGDCSIFFQGFPPAWFVGNQARDRRRQAHSSAQHGPQFEKIAAIHAVLFVVLTASAAGRVCIHKV
jgi:hypothetical protein